MGMFRCYNQNGFQKQAMCISSIIIWRGYMFFGNTIEEQYMTIVAINRKLKNGEG